MERAMTSATATPEAKTSERKTRTPLRIEMEGFMFMGCLQSQDWASIGTLNGGARLRRALISRGQKSGLARTLAPPGSWRRSSMRKFCRRWIRDRVEFLCPAIAKPQRNEPENAEGTINQPPINWNAPKSAEDERIRHNERAGNDAELKEPDVAHRVAQRANERNSDHEMSECKPVEAIGHERIPGVGVVQRVARFQNPLRETRRRLLA